MRRCGSRRPCSNCRKFVASYDIINLGSIESGYRQLCGQCFNAESAKLGGLDKFEHLNFEPLRIIDCEGEPHDFISVLGCSCPVWR